MGCFLKLIAVGIFIYAVNFLPRGEPNQEDLILVTIILSLLFFILSNTYEIDQLEKKIKDLLGE